MIRVGFSRATGFWSFLSWIIRKVTKRPFSHVWLLLDGEDSICGVEMVLESNEHGGLHFVPWTGYSVGKEIVEIVVPPWSLRPGYLALLERLGYGYDFPGLFGEGVRIAWNEWFKRKIANPFRDAHKLWCSEAGAFAIQTCHDLSPTVVFPLMRKDDWQRCTPGDVYDLLKGKAVES